MKTTDEQAALLRAIREQPECDTTRLVYADWLDENGQPDRAEFIRVHVERAQLLTPVMRRCTGEDGGPIPDPMVQRHAELGRRESALLAAHRKDWCPKCHFCIAGKIPGVTAHTLQNCAYCTGTGHVGTFKRGLLTRVNVPTLETVWTDRCETCQGFGATHYNNPSSPCPSCSGTTIGPSGWCPTAWAREHLAEYLTTVREVWCGDREPCNRISGLGSPFPDQKAAWDKPAAGLPLSHRVHWLPPPVFDKLKRNECDTVAEAQQELFYAVADSLREVLS